jgi:hypothetical protein
MTDNSGNSPSDPHILPGQPGREPPVSVNGPALERFAAGEPPSMSAAALAAGERERKISEQKDAFRETVETIVFVVVLVLLLKAFMAEAFVIPTGSMATTLLGYHRNIECPACGFRFPLNLSKELDAQEMQPQRITGCTCPNCFLRMNATNSSQFPP